MVTTFLLCAGMATWQRLNAPAGRSAAMQREPFKVHDNQAYEASGAVRASGQAVSPAPVRNLHHMADSAGEKCCCIAFVGKCMTMTPLSLLLTSCMLPFAVQAVLQGLTFNKGLVFLSCAKGGLTGCTDCDPEL